MVFAIQWGSRRNEEVKNTKRSYLHLSDFEEISEDAFSVDSSSNVFAVKFIDRLDWFRLLLIYFIIIDRQEISRNLCRIKSNASQKDIKLPIGIHQLEVTSLIKIILGKANRWYFYVFLRRVRLYEELGENRHSERYSPNHL